MGIVRITEEDVKKNVRNYRIKQTFFVFRSNGCKCDYNSVVNCILLILNKGLLLELFICQMRIRQYSLLIT